MRPHALWLAAAVAAWTTRGTGALADGPATEPDMRPLSRTFTVEEAVQLALESNPLLLSRQATARGARHLERSARGRMLPVVHFFDEGQHWDSAFSVAFGPSSFTVRNQNVNTLAVSADQP